MLDSFRAPTNPLPSWGAQRSARRGMATFVDPSVMNILSAQAQHGLLLGLETEQSGLFLVPTPINPSAEKKILDKDWIVEHAFQVSRMLTGNVEIIGFFYVSENFEKIKPVESQLHSIVKSIASQRKTAAVRRHTNTRYFILEISSSNKSCRLLESDTKLRADQPAKECPLQLSPLSKEIHSFEARVFVDVEVPLRSGLRLSLREQIKKGLVSVERNFASAVVTMDGAAVNDAQPLSSLKSKSHTVEIFCDTFAAPLGDTSSSAGAIEAVIRYSGTISARAYCSSSSLIQTAIDRLLSDVIESVHLRLEALCEEYTVQKKGANLDAGSLDEANLRGKEQKWILQRRVFVPLLPPVMLADYLSAEETLQDCEARCVDLLGLKPPEGSIESWLVPGESLFAVAKPEKVAAAKSPVPSAAEKGAKVKQDLQAKMAPLEKAQPTIPTRIYGFIALAVLIALAAFYFQYWLVSHYKPE